MTNELRINAGRARSATRARRKQMKDTQTRPTGRWEHIVSPSLWTLRGTPGLTTYVMGRRLALHPIAARARRHLLR